MEKIDLDKLVCSLLKGKSHGDCLCVEDLELALEYQGLEYRDGQLSRIWVPYSGDICRPKNGKGNNILLCSREGLGFSFVEYRKNGIAGGNISLYELKRDYELVERRNDAGDIVEGFAKKMAEGEQPIPQDIQEVVNDHFYEMLGDEETESVFNVGDWLVCKDVTWPHGPFVVVSDYHDGFVKAQMQDGSFFIVNTGVVRKWTIRDAKPGDVLSTDDWVFIFKEINYGPGNGIKCYCHYDYDDGVFRVDADRDTHMVTGGTVRPATKEQRDLLFRKIAEEGFEWNSGTEDMPKKK